MAWGRISYQGHICNIRILEESGCEVQRGELSCREVMAPEVIDRVTPGHEASRGFDVKRNELSEHQGHV